MGLIKEFNKKTVVVSVFSGFVVRKKCFCVFIFLYFSMLSGFGQWYICDWSRKRLGYSTCRPSLLPSSFSLYSFSPSIWSSSGKKAASGTMKSNLGGTFCSCWWRCSLCRWFAQLDWFAPMMAWLIRIFWRHNWWRIPSSFSVRLYWNLEITLNPSHPSCKWNNETKNKTYVFLLIIKQFYTSTLLWLSCWVWCDQWITSIVIGVDGRRSGRSVCSSNG